MKVAMNELNPGVGEDQLRPQSFQQKKTCLVQNIEKFE